MPQELVVQRCGTRVESLEQDRTPSGGAVLRGREGLERCTQARWRIALHVGFVPDPVGSREFSAVLDGGMKEVLCHRGEAAYEVDSAD